MSDQDTTENKPRKTLRERVEANRKAERRAKIEHEITMTRARYSVHCAFDAKRCSAVAMALRELPSDASLRDIEIAAWDALALAAETEKAELTAALNTDADMDPWSTASDGYYLANEMISGMRNMLAQYGEDE